MMPGTKKTVICLLDVTEHKRSEESLRILEERYHAFVENTQEAILIVQDGSLKFANPRISEILGYAKDEITSRSFKEFIHPEDRKIVEYHANKVKEGELAQVYPFRMIHKDGSIRWLENRVAFIQWEKRPAELNSITDITDRRQAEEELRHSIEPFRALVNAMEKILPSLNRA